jgi:hypothetical protein
MVRPFSEKLITTDTHQLKDVKNTDIALIPQPSDDVNDPLNWCKWKKSVAFLCVCFYAFLGSWIMGGVTLGIPGIITEFDVSLNNAVNGLISWVVLTLGVGVVSKARSVILICAELRLDSNGPLLRQETCLSLRFIPRFRRDNLVCGG